MKGYSEEQLKALVEREEKRKARQKLQTAKQLAKMKVLRRKAEAAGIVVTEEEIMEEINKK